MDDVISATTTRSQSSAIYHEPATAFQSQFERKRRAAGLVIPTDDGQVKLRLRELHEPITLFGEGKAERRDRLRVLLLDRQDQFKGTVTGHGIVSHSDSEEISEEHSKDDEEFYTEGSEELLKARKSIALLSLKQARRRILFQKAESSISLRTHIKQRNTVKERLKGFESFASQMVHQRPISITRFSPSGDTIAAGSWDGSIKILDVPTLDERLQLRGHGDRVGGLSWFPGATMSSQMITETSLNLASGGGGGEIQLWSLTSDSPIATLSGHTGRTSRVEFHPSGKYLASASYDTTWRLWDVNTQSELLLQEGHSREVHTVSFNSDGSLLASGGLDSIGRVWDLRTGRTIMILSGHMKEIYGMDWSPDGHRLLTGSGDGLAICWDVRMVRETARIPANSHGVTDLKWFRGLDGPTHRMLPDKDVDGGTVPKKSGTFFVSCGLDSNVSIFSASDWAPCRTLSGHTGNVLSTDVSSNSRWIVSGGKDRTVKLWARDDMEGV